MSTGQFLVFLKASFLLSQSVTTATTPAAPHLNGWRDKDFFLLIKKIHLFYNPIAVSPPSSLPPFYPLTFLLHLHAEGALDNSFLEVGC